MKILALIPARMGSSRFPGKPMKLILGMPMIGHVYQRVALNETLSMTAVATCDPEIFKYIQSIGGRAVMTGDHHVRASDRCAEALAKLEQEDGVIYDIVVMVQGDEPLVYPEMITEALSPFFNDPTVLVSNLLGKITKIEEFEDRNCIKAVCNLIGDAMYFSREPIPTRSKIDTVAMGKQICVIPFRRQFLIDYTNLPPTPLEIAESVDMLRVLEHGKAVRMIPTLFATQSVDTQSDLSNVERLMSSDPLYRKLNLKRKI
jgi:3-deoxy-manno-octulosonate cytidylyltransferase (CMP-KDO synthetase)